MSRTGFFRAGMGTQFGRNWRYKRQEMQLFINKYQAISIPVHDIERIRDAVGVERIVVIEKATGYKYIAPISALEHGYQYTMPKWKEPHQFFIPIEYWTMKIGMAE